jgi:hypothetical protein
MQMYLIVFQSANSKLVNLYFVEHTGHNFLAWYSNLDVEQKIFCVFWAFAICCSCEAPVAATASVCLYVSSCSVCFIYDRITWAINNHVSFIMVRSHLRGNLPEVKVWRHGHTIRLKFGRNVRNPVQRACDRFSLQHHTIETDACLDVRHES